MTTTSSPEAGTKTTWDVLVDREIQVWVSVEASSIEEARRIACALPIEIHPSRFPHSRDEGHLIRTFSRHAVSPGAGEHKYGGRGRVVKANRLYDGQWSILLACGHGQTIPADTWKPEDPYVDCPSCQRHIERLADGDQT